MPATRARALVRDTGPVATAAVGAGMVAALGIRGGDYPAQLLRAELWDRSGVSVWNFHWYGGHATPTYSLISPPLVAWLGAWTVAAVSGVVATWLFGRLVRGWSQSSWALAGVHLFALCATVNVIVGRVPFALGLAFAMVALSGWRRGHAVTALAAALLVPLTSPVVAVFVAVVASAWTLDAALDRRWNRSTRIGAGVLAAVLAPLAALSHTFHSEGRFPFRPDQAAFSISLMVLLAVLTDHRVIRIAMLIAASVSVVVFAVPNPLGGNFLRFTQFAVVPLCLAAFGATTRRRVTWFAVVAAIASAWSLQFGVVSTVAWSGDASTSQAFHQPLVDEVRIRNLDGEPLGRLEVPFTQNHWESYFVAGEVPFARGWERQLDLELNASLYDPELGVTEYRRWLDHNAVRWIALPDVAFDAGGAPEAALIRSGALDAWLTPVWSNGDWVLYEVAGYTPLVDPPARFVEERTDDVVIDVGAAATVTLRFRFADDMSVSPAGCVSASPDGWTLLSVPGAGRYTVRVDPDSVVGTGDRCAGPDPD